MPPLILTLMLDPASQGFFERERQRWFPSSRNLIPAHVTLFHRIPGDQAPRVHADLAMLCALEKPSPFSVGGLAFLGRGVAYTLDAAAAAGFRASLMASWQGGPDPLALTAQDRQPWRPHVTVQNKAEPREARALHARLSHGFLPFSGTASGVTLWRYLGGPWEHEGDFAFAG